MRVGGCDNLETMLSLFVVRRQNRGTEGGKSEVPVKEEDERCGR
jgi:hypothetical protein